MSNDGQPGSAEVGLAVIGALLDTFQITDIIYPAAMSAFPVFGDA